MIFLFVFVALALALYALYPSIKAGVVGVSTNTRSELEDERDFVSEQIDRIKSEIENGIEPESNKIHLLSYETKLSLIISKLSDLPIKTTNLAPSWPKVAVIFVILSVLGILIWQFIVPPLQELALPAEEAKILHASRRFEAIKNQVSESTSTQKLLEFAQIAWEAQNYEKAASIYTIILRRNPAQPTAIRRYGILLFFAGENEEALHLLDAAIKLDPNEPESYLNKGNLLFSTNDPAGAIEAWENYRRLNPNGSSRVSDLIAAARSRLEENDLGAKLFATNCAGCHGSKGQGIVGPKLIDNIKAKDLNFTKNIIKNGKGQMPPSTKIKESDLEILVKFVEKLANETR